MGSAEEIRNVMPHTKEVRRLNLDAQYHTLTTASADKTACLLDMRNLNVVQTYKADIPINDAHVSPIGDHVLLAGGTEAVDVTTTGGSTSSACASTTRCTASTSARSSATSVLSTAS